jgi:hypothetical protein
VDRALEKLEMHDVVVRDGSAGPSVFALHDNLFVILVLAPFESLNTSTKAFSDTSVSWGCVWHS